MIVHRGEIELQRGPKENLQRPCINVMFRSAAAAYEQQIVGVVLTGLLDDGAAGLWAIQQHGGSTIVQDPEEASHRSMPDSAIAGLNVEYILPLQEIGSVLARLSMNNNVSSSVSSQPVTSELSRQACPECGGVMKVFHFGKLIEYTCHVGHRLGARTMMVQKSEVIERSLWNAVCQTEELLDLLRKEKPQDASAAEALSAEIAQREQHISGIKRILETGGAASLVPQSD